MEHDASYKKLFSYPQMVADLLRGFVHEPWVAEADLGTLEKVSGSYVADDLREREDDTIWRVRLRDGWLYVYLLLEFQSAVDPFMAVRVMTYEALLYQDLISRRELTPDGRLQPVVPIVLYRGRWRWHAATDIGSLIAEGPSGLEVYRPHARYLLIDEGVLREEELAPLRNLAAALFRLENSRLPEDVRRVVECLIEWLGAPEQVELRRSFTTWINQVLLPARLPGQTVPDVRDLLEVRSMLEERVIEWTMDWKQQGRQEGRQEGRRLAVLDLLEIRFGMVPERVQQAVNRLTDLARLRMLHKQAMLVPSLEAFELTLAQSSGNGDSALN
ncbi:MAG: Rpn family recombination-promoting nuclease/putative transposase [Chloroflexi bacterium]|nr:Rpn family recombination-promoting nuclease/putative transposase [Chloroflexota bacterium]